MNRNTILVAFFLAGFTTMVYEVAWSRPLYIIFGSTVFTVATIITTFLAGFAIGSFVLGRFGDRCKRPLLAFVGIEAGIGLYGLFMIAILRSLPGMMAGLHNIPGFRAVQFLFCFLLIIIPATLMGAAWPLANKAYIDPKQESGDAGTLYSSNAFGASLGPLAAGFFLIPALGITLTSISSAILNMLVALMIFIQIRRSDDEN